MQIPLGNIYLETFDSTSVLHQQVLEDLLTQSSSKFISSIDSRLNLNQGLKSFPFDTAFLVRVESGEVVGYVFISKIIQDEVFLEYSILKEKRRQGYGSQCLNLVSDYLFENYNIKDITLDIDPSNIASVQTALSCGYDLDEEEYLEKGLQGRTLYKKDNIYYCNKRKKK